MARSRGPRGVTRQVSVTVPEELIGQIDEEAKARGMTRSALMVLTSDLYFREQRMAAGDRAEGPCPAQDVAIDRETAQEIRTRLDAIERKSDRLIELVRGAKEAARAVPDLIRKDLMRHLKPLHDFAKNDAVKGAEGRRIIAEQADENGRALSEISDRIGRISQALAAAITKNEG